MDVETAVGAESTTAEPMSSPKAGTAEYAAWRTTGKITPKPAAPAAAKESSEATSKGEAESAAESDTATHQEPGKGAEKRIKQLLAEKKELERKLAEGKPPEGKTETKPVESSTAKTQEQPKPENKLEAPKKPKLDDFKTYDEYEAAKDEYFDKLADYKSQKALQDYRQQQATEAANKEFQSKFSDVVKRYPDAKEVIMPAADAIFKDQGIPLTLRTVIDGSKVFLDLLYVLGSDKAELDSFISLAKSDPQEAIRKVVLTESLVKEQLKGTETAAERGADGKFKSAAESVGTAPEKKETKAPPPPHEVGARGTTPPDAADSAVKANNFRAFREAQNRKDAAKRQGR